MASLIGDNSNTLTDRQKKVLMAHHVTRIIAKEAEKAEIAKQIREIKAEAKEDGFPASKIDHFIKAMQSQDKQKPVSKFLAERENLIALGLIADDRGGDLLADRATTEQRIFAAGEAAGLLGLDCGSGYDAGSVDDKTWVSGWKAGQKAMLDELAEAMRKANAKRETPEISEDAFEGVEP